METPTPIAGYPDYGVTTDGGFWSRRKSWKNPTGEWVRLADAKSKDYYRCAEIYNENGSRLTSVHILVLETFRGPRPHPKMRACHNNDIKCDNRIENLRWDTSSENSNDIYRNGTRTKKYSDSAAAGVRRLSGMGWDARILCVLFNVPSEFVYAVRSGKIRKGV